MALTGALGQALAGYGRQASRSRPRQQYSRYAGVRASGQWKGGTLNSAFQSATGTVGRRTPGGGRGSDEIWSNVG